MYSERRRHKIRTTCPMINVCNSLRWIRSQVSHERFIYINATYTRKISRGLHKTQTGPFIRARLKIRPKWSYKWLRLIGDYQSLAFVLVVIAIAELCELSRERGKNCACAVWVRVLRKPQTSRDTIYTIGFASSCISRGLFKGPSTDLFEPLLRKIYSHLTSSFLVSSELFHVFYLFQDQ